MIKTCIEVTLFTCTRQKSKQFLDCFCTAPPYKKRQKFTQAEHCSRCPIGSTLTFKINALNMLKVQNGCTEVLFDLKSTKLLLLRSLYANKACLNNAESETTFQWLLMGISPPCCFLIRPSSKFM